MQNLCQLCFPRIGPGGRDLEKLKLLSSPETRWICRWSALNAFAEAELVQNSVFALPFTRLPLPLLLWSHPVPALVLPQHSPSPALQGKL